MVLPISIEEIEDSAFENCCSLKSISLPMALKTIGDGALKGTGLRTIEIPKSVLVRERTGGRLSVYGESDNS